MDIYVVGWDHWQLPYNNDCSAGLSGRCCHEVVLNTPSDVTMISDLVNQMVTCVKALYALLHFVRLLRRMIHRFCVLGVRDIYGCVFTSLTDGVRLLLYVFASSSDTMS